MKRRVLWVVALAATVTPLTSATAAPVQVGLSPDGSAFTSTLADPLFDPATSWVPGDVREATFYVRNQGGSAARLTLDILGRQPSPLFATGDLSVSASAPGSTSSAAATDAADHELLSKAVVEDGAVVPVTVRIAFSSASSNISQQLTSPVDLRVTLTGLDYSGVASRAVSVGQVNQSGLLPDTGAPDLLLLAIIASLCLGTGAALISRRRHDTEGTLHG